MSWEIINLYPDEMLEPMKVVSKDFPGGSIAGSLGKKVNGAKKPGINEDGGLVAISEQSRICLLIDGHYQRDTTELMIELLQDEIITELWNFTDLSTSSIILRQCLSYVDTVLETLRSTNARGEASFVILYHNMSYRRLYYFSVGDLLMFVNDRGRPWGSEYQISSRHFYEWINARELMGYHFGEVPAVTGTKFILATDGLYDQPTFTLQEIKQLFTIQPFHAETYTKYALQHTPVEEDDNVSVICLEF